MRSIGCHRLRNHSEDKYGYWDGDKCSFKKFSTEEQQVKEADAAAKQAVVEDVQSN